MLSSTIKSHINESNMKMILTKLLSRHLRVKDVILLSRMTSCVPLRFNEISNNVFQRSIFDLLSINDVIFTIECLNKKITYIDRQHSMNVMSEDDYKVCEWMLCGDREDHLYVIVIEDGCNKTINKYRNYKLLYSVRDISSQQYRHYTGYSTSEDDNIDILIINDCLILACHCYQYSFSRAAKRYLSIGYREGYYLIARDLNDGTECIHREATEDMKTAMKIILEYYNHPQSRLTLEKDYYDEY